MLEYKCHCLVFKPKVDVPTITSMDPVIIPFANVGH